MEKITTIGLDIAKHVFQIHGVDVSGNAGIRRRLRRIEVLAFFAVGAVSPPPSNWQWNRRLC